MNLIKTLNLISHLKWLILLWMVILIVMVFISVPNIEINQIGTAIFLCGIFLGLESLGDSTTIKEKELKLYADKRNVKFQSTILTGTVILVLVISLFFLSM